jgi:hypothetical protein
MEASAIVKSFSFAYRFWAQIERVIFVEVKILFFSLSFALRNHEFSKLLWIVWGLRCGILEQTDHYIRSNVFAYFFRGATL